MIVTLKFNVGWLISRQNDDDLPIAHVINGCIDAFGEKVSVKKRNLSCVSFSFTESEPDPLVQFIYSFLFSEYGLKEDSDLFTLTIDSENDDSEINIPPVAKLGGLSNDKGAFDRIRKLLDDFGFEDDDDDDFSKRATGRDDKRSSGDPETEPKRDISEYVDELSDFIGGDDFKALVKETAKIAPEIVKNKTKAVFTSRCYLFSINDGNGLDDYLEFFSKFIDATGIASMNRTNPFVSLVIPPKRPNDGAEFADVEKTLRYGDEDAMRILCVDISEWMNSLETREFKSFLTRIESSADEYITVFRIPFVDREVASRVLESLNDVLCVRYVAFPPFTNEEMQEIACREFKKFGFEMDDDSWQYFHKRIIKEKSDGKFYGTKTVKKVVREMLYIKQLDNADKGVSDYTIKPDEAARICPKPRAGEITGEEELLKMVGGAALKQKIDEIVAQILLAKAENNVKSPCIHMRFVGNPGTGKTTVARVLGKILKERGVLRVGNFFEVSGRDLCGRYVGETAPKTSSICRDAYGSVLFIDEAYSLFRGNQAGNDFGREALDTLIAEMENNRSDLVVIMAGYTDDIETMMKGNSGLAGRMPYEIRFPNFTRDQLFEIYKSMVEGTFNYDQDFLPAVSEYFGKLPDSVMDDKAFSNGRFVRNVFERTWGKAATRCQINKKDAIVLTADDFLRAVSDNDFKLTNAKRKRIGFGNGFDENE